MKQRARMAAFAAGLIFMLGGCKAVSAPSQPGITTFYHQAALEMNNFSVILQQAQNDFAAAHTAGYIPNVEFVQGEQGFLSIAENGDTVVRLLQSGADQATVLQSLARITQQVQTMPRAFALKNPQAQLQFVAITTTLATVLQAATVLVHP